MSSCSHGQVCALVVATLILGVSGCAATKAHKQPGKKDLSFLKPGTHRRYITAELGSPIRTEVTPNGRSDTYRFVQGYSKGTIVMRTAGHIVGDFMTAGLWEIAGIPIENMADGTPVEVSVAYDNTDRVVSVTEAIGTDLVSDKAHAPEGARQSAPAGNHRPPP